MDEKPKYSPPDTYICRACGRKILRQSVVWVGNGVPLCSDCALKRQPKKEKS